MSTRCTGSDRVLSLHWKDVCFKTGCAFQDNNGKSLWDEGSFHSCLEQNHEDWGGSFHSMQCVTGTLLSFVQSKSAIYISFNPTHSAHSPMYSLSSLPQTLPVYGWPPPGRCDGEGPTSAPASPSSCGLSVPLGTGQMLPSALCGTFLTGSANCLESESERGGGRVCRDFDYCADGCVPL